MLSGDRLFWGTIHLTAPTGFWRGKNFVSCDFFLVVGSEVGYITLEVYYI